MSRVPREWEGGPWFMGRQDTFREWAASDAFPRWLRTTFAAYSNLAANGHAEFRQQELAGLLGEEVDGIWVPARRQRVREAIDAAIDRHLLLPESKALCLIVPRSAVAYGVGNADADCRRHPRRNARTVSPRAQTTRLQPVVSTPKERPSRVVSGSAPLSSNNNPQAERRTA